MKVIQVLPVFVSLFCLTFIVGCGDIEEASNSVNSMTSGQALTLEELATYQEGTRVAGAPSHPNQSAERCCSSMRGSCICPESKPCPVKCDQW